MKQDFLTFNPCIDTPKLIDKRVSYRLAGQAAAIYLGNKQKQLPAVHFDIQIKQPVQYLPKSSQSIQHNNNHSAMIVGGRLIQSLYMGFPQMTHYFSKLQKEQYKCAIEADVINLLAGPLAEAKYVVLYDNEAFKINLLNLDSLRFYATSTDLEIISECMECYIPDQVDREQKLKELFLAAFNFVNKRSNWRAISKVADYIQNKPMEIITCEEVISLMGFYSIDVTANDVCQHSGINKFPSLSSVLD